MYVSALKGIPKNIAGKRAAELLEEVGLGDVAKKKVKTFSGGMKQGVGIEQALLNNPEILIPDEPTAGLDPKERFRFRNLLSDYSGDKIVILSTHIVADIEAIADEVLLMKKGKFVLQGSVSELIKKADGKVWELTVPQEEARKWQAKSTVANLRHEGGQVALRIISDHKPGEAAVPCEAALEDLYLYYFPTEQPLFHHRALSVLLNHHRNTFHPYSHAINSSPKNASLYIITNRFSQMIKNFFNNPPLPNG